MSPNKTIEKEIELHSDCCNAPVRVESGGNPATPDSGLVGDLDFLTSHYCCTACNNPCVGLL